MKLRSRKRKNGKTIYFMDYRLNGRRYQKKIEAVRTRKEAQEVADLFWAKIVRDNALGEYAPETSATRCLTIGDAVETDVNRPGVSPWTRRMERSLGKNLTRKLGSQTPVVAIGTRDLEEYKRSRLEDAVRPYGKAAAKRGDRREDIPKVQPITINKELEYLRAMFNRLKKNRVVPRLTCEITKLPADRHRARALTEAQLLALLAACAEHSDDMLEKTVFFANTGFRKGELFLARWSDLDHTVGHIRVLTKKKGTSNEYYEDLVPLNQAAADALKARRCRVLTGEDNLDLIFGIPPEKRKPCATAKHPDRPGTVDGIQCYWDHGYGDKLKAAAKRAEIPWWKSLRIHHLRHSFATITLDKGANIMEVARLIRHRDPMLTVRTYLHTRDEGVMKAINGLNFGLGLKAAP